MGAQNCRRATSAASESLRFVVSAEGYGTEDFPERGATPKIFPPTEKFEVGAILSQLYGCL
eukprot:COSAG02_NODE_14629_length_1253_cov_0.974870_1_plen_61_part_00